jgi:general secretion pathway protein J
LTGNARHREPCRHDGFTLLELLIAISILALTFTLMTGGIRFGVAAWEKGSDIGRHAGEIRTAHRILRRQIEQLRPVTKRQERRQRRGRRAAFAGEPETMQFIAPPPAQSAAPGIYLIRLAIETAQDGKRLTMAWRRLQPDHADFTEDRDMETAVLGQGLASGTIDYFGRARGEDVARWHRRWVERNVVPELIRIRLTYPDGADRQWPDLIAAPQLGAR